MPNLTLLGPFPPPFGGVALHLVRLREALVSLGVDVVGASMSRMSASFTGVHRVGWREALPGMPLHMHTDEGNARATVALTGLWRVGGRRYGLTFHSFRMRDDLRQLDTRLALACKRARLVIAISNDVKQALIDRLGLGDETITVIPSALPISQWELNQPLPDIPQAWMDAKIRVIANAGRVVRYENADLYGIDLLLQAFKSINNPDASLLVVLGTVVDDSLAAELFALAQADPRIHIVTQIHSPLTPVTRMSHVVVRPTRTEGGESLTLSEARELGVWAVGSDAVQRPAGTVLFQNNNAEHLAQVLAEVMSRTSMPTPVVGNAGVVDEMVMAYRKAGLLPA